VRDSESSPRACARDFEARAAGVPATHSEWTTQEVAPSCAIVVKRSRIMGTLPSSKTYRLVFVGFVDEVEESVDWGQSYCGAWLPRSDRSDSPSGIPTQDVKTAGFLCVERRRLVPHRQWY
jgi:hypothetical protein